MTELELYGEPTTLDAGEFLSLQLRSRSVRWPDGHTVEEETADLGGFGLER